MIKKTIMFTALSTLLMTSGCTTLDPATREVKTSNATAGATIGAVGGALLGAMTGQSSRGVLLGAGIGALAGGAIGNSIDQEEAALRAQLDHTGVRIERCDNNSIRLIMPCDITFSNDSARIQEDFYETLDSVAVVLKRFNCNLVKVSGFTSSTGSYEHNQILSEQRAKSVAHFLTCAGVNSTRIIAVGYGPRYSIASNASGEGRALNRRVEIMLRPLDAPF